MSQDFLKFLDDEINIQELEQWIYKQTDLEERLGEDNYFFLIEFNFNKRYAQIEIKDFLINNVVSEKQFSTWKMQRLLDTEKIIFPQDNLYEFAKQNPNFLEGKTLNFKQFRDKKKIEITFAKEVCQFTRQISELGKGKYLYLGSYEDSYIHLVVNKKNEIWIAYDIIDKEDYFAPNVNEAIKKLILGNSE